MINLFIKWIWGPEVNCGGRGQRGRGGGGDQNLPVWSSGRGGGGGGGVRYLKRQINGIKQHPGTRKVRAKHHLPDLLSHSAGRGSDRIKGQSRNTSSTS